MKISIYANIVTAQPRNKFGDLGKNLKNKYKTSQYLFLFFSELIITIC